MSHKPFLEAVTSLVLCSKCTHPRLNGSGWHPSKCLTSAVCCCRKLSWFCKLIKNFLEFVWTLLIQKIVSATLVWGTTMLGYELQQHYFRLLPNNLLAGGHSLLVQASRWLPTSRIRQAKRSILNSSQFIHFVYPMPVSYRYWIFYWRNFMNKFLQI